MKKRIWIIYDLGFDGDYTKLYEWLDRQDAKECVIGGATFFFDFAAQEEDKDVLFQEIKSSLPHDISENTSARIYIIFSVNDVMVGRFLFGRRKVAPWFGCNHQETEEEDE